MKTKRSGPMVAVVGFVLLAAGVVCSLLARGSAIGDGAGDTGELLYALSLILALVGLVTGIAGLLRGRSSLEDRRTDVRALALASLFAALCYMVFPSLKLTSPWGRKKRPFTWATCSAFWRPSSWGVCGVVWPVLWV